jgi:hypothetical protein
LTGIHIRPINVVFQAPRDFCTPLGAFFVWSFTGPDTEINKSQSTEMRNYPKVDKAQNRSVTQIIKKNYNSKPDPHGLPVETGVIGWTKNSMIKSDPVLFVCPIRCFFYTVLHGELGGKISES